MYCCTDNLINRKILLRAGSSRAIREGPSRLAVNSVVASALVVSPASTVTIASIGAVSSNRGDY